MFLLAFAFFSGELIGPQENQEQLESYVQEFSEEEYEIVNGEDFRLFLSPGEQPQLDKEIERLILRHVKNGSTVVEYGAKRGEGILQLIPILGPQGRVVAFESNPVLFRQMYWNLMLNGVQNAQIYCTVLGENEKTLDRHNLKNVSLIRVDASGREDVFLRGAENTIKSCKPVLIINILGGISLEYSDRYVKQEYESRLDNLHRMGYTTQCIRKNLYLALPK